MYLKSSQNIAIIKEKWGIGDYKLSECMLKKVSEYKIYLDELKKKLNEQKMTVQSKKGANKRLILNDTYLAKYKNKKVVTKYYELKKELIECFQRCELEACEFDFEEYENILADPAKSFFVKTIVDFCILTKTKVCKLDKSIIIQVLEYSELLNK